eukprot:1189529-Prorocentrum_minimum.AAC.6
MTEKHIRTPAPFACACLAYLSQASLYLYTSLIVLEQQTTMARPETEGRSSFCALWASIPPLPSALL